MNTSPETRDQRDERHRSLLLRRNEIAARWQLAEDLQRPIRGLARTVCVKYQLADDWLDDLASEGYEAAIRCIDLFDEKAGAIFAKYALGGAWYAMMGLLRSSTVVGRSGHANGARGLYADGEIDAEREMWMSEIAEQVRSPESLAISGEIFALATDSLSERERRSVLLLLDGSTLKEVGLMAGMGVPSAQALCARALDKMRRAVGFRGAAPTGFAQSMGNYSITAANRGAGSKYYMLPAVTRTSRGTAHPRSLLDETKVRAMRQMREAGTSVNDIARHFRVSEGCAYAVIVRKTWRHVS